LEERLKADYGRAVGEEKSLKTALMISKGEAVRQNQAAIQYSVLQQDLATAKSLYTDFLNKTSQANIQRAEQFNNVRLIEGAEPPDSPIGPNRYLPIMFSLILSLTLGIGLAYLMENLNTTLRTVEEVSRVTQLPMLAVIPTLKAAIPQVQLNDHSDEPVVANSERMIWAAAEAYRMLRTSILLSTAEHPPKTVLVTSGQPGDGKTATVFNIAYALAQLNAEVVIVDCDMRKPRTRKLDQLANDEGLSTLLTGGGALDEFIKTTSVPHLSILPSGAAPPNPSELISSDKMKQLLRSLAERFEYVIIDSPPVATFTDPMILSKLVDGVILVVKSGQSKGELVRRVCQDFSSVGAKVLGVTLNSFNMRKEGYGYYQYYRYYSDYGHSDYASQASRNLADE
jgi:capsular exopolysaccharide synthesis family protein